jgi:hypothetical protein
MSSIDHLLSHLTIHVSGLPTVSRPLELFLLLEHVAQPGRVVVGGAESVPLAVAFPFVVWAWKVLGRRR